jgi:glutamine amidotransferase
VLTVVDLGVGNLASLKAALRFIGAEFEVSADAEQVSAAQAIVLPGVGAFDAAVSRLDALGLRRPLTERSAADVPILGICLGMQLLFATSEEGRADGLGIFDATVVRLGREASSKVPHVGFDRVEAEAGTWLGEALGPSPDFYFTHSFAAVEGPAGATIGRCSYDGGFVAAIERWPVVGAQFHPEKSQSAGLSFLASFLRRARSAG